MKAKKLPSGNYRVQVVAGFDPSGKRIVKSFTADTEWEAMRMAEYFKRDREETTGKNITVAKAMEMYIDSRENVIEKTTVRSYRQITNNCFKCIMDVKLSSLRAIDIQRAINIESARISPKYIKNAYGLLKSVLKMFYVSDKFGMCDEIRQLIISDGMNEADRKKLLKYYPNNENEIADFLTKVIIFSLNRPTKAGAESPLMSERINIQIPVFEIKQPKVSMALYINLRKLEEAEVNNQLLIELNGK